MGRSEADLSILLTGDEEIGALNRRFRGKDRATDVLSFPPAPGAGHAAAGTFLGDVVISMERAEVQARRAGVTLEEEVRRLLAHGILHLVGFDHEGSEEEAEAMRHLEDRYTEGGG